MKRRLGRSVKTIVIGQSVDSFFVLFAFADIVKIGDDAADRWIFQQVAEARLDPPIAAILVAECVVPGSRCRRVV